MLLKIEETGQDLRIQIIRPIDDWIERVEKGEL